ncbi:hypothetical protein [Paeniglutamicibacter sulfureus]|uniref:Integral membrane protein n=1 Tax=Paeniglutamicibacter sulfureus TaxID=43666 RepID=A0ABU2BQN2_9MICC|nr:hypothetical protein [Paeniglutamicibacter sulfureus]MDR7360058.1 hypothetical protein [Paeniglutamicibacter sulfureus]
MRIATAARNILAIVLLMLAVLLGAGSLLGSAATTVVHTPEPLQRILSPLATDPQLRQVLPDELGAALEERITGGAAVPPQLAGALQNAIAAAGAAMLDDPGFPGAWEQTIEEARADFTARMAEAKGAEQVTLRLDLAPLLGSGWDTLQTSLEGSVLGALLPTEVSMPPAVLETGWPDAQQLPTPTLNTWLAVARGWPWLLAGAVVAAAAGLLLATRGGRPWAVFAAGCTALALGGAARLWFAVLGPVIAPAQGAGVESLVTGRLLGALEEEVGRFAAILGGGGIVLVIAGIGWATVAGLAAHRAPRRG